MWAQNQSPFVSTLLRDEVLLWYRSCYEKWVLKTPLTWEILHDALRDHFAPPSEDRGLQDAWAHLRQQGTAFAYESVLIALAPNHDLACNHTDAITLYETSNTRMANKCHAYKNRLHATHIGSRKYTASIPPHVHKYRDNRDAYSTSMVDPNCGNQNRDNKRPCQIAVR